MTAIPFEDRAHAGRALAERLRGIPMRDPVVLAIPRGGLEVALPIAQALDAELDVALSRKLRAPDRTELAIGAVNESGDIVLNGHSHLVRQAGAAWLEGERRHQMEAIAKFQSIFRGVRPKARVRHRTVIVVDDGVATGSTMIAALRMLKDAAVHETIVAVPVGARESMTQVRAMADRVICLEEPEVFWAVGQFFQRFDQVGDERAAALLQQGLPQAAQPSPAPTAATYQRGAILRHAPPLAAGQAPDANQSARPRGSATAE